MNNNDYQNEILKLKKQVERLKKSVKKQKYGLVWMDVPEAFEDDVENKLPILKEVPELAIKNDDGKPTHILIEGDNYHALTCLNYTHKGKIDVIYIDPPYNTGSDGFRYKDKRVLDKYPDGTEVPKDHPFRHSYWLSFMKKRLELSRDLLSEKGVIFISIDENEMKNLIHLMDEIYGEKNHIADLIWKKKKGGSNDSKHIAVEHEYIVFYAKNIDSLPNLFSQYKNGYSSRYNLSDDIGKYYWDTFKRKSGKQYYPIKCPDGTVLELDENGNKISWLRSEKRFLSDLKSGDAKIVQLNGKWSVQFKQRQPTGKKPRSILDSFGTTSDGSQELLEIFKKNVFDNPKPSSLIEYLLSFTTNNNSTILDFFAGSGTTFHAVEKANSQDNTNRQCILITNNENKIMSDVCYPRTKAVINGYEFEGVKKEILFQRKITWKNFQKSEEILDEVNQIINSNHNFDKLKTTLDAGILTLLGERKINGTIDGLGGSIKYYKTAFVGKRNILNIKDEDKVELAHNAGELLALSENTLDLINKDDWMQLYENNDRYTAIYFREEMTNFERFKSEVKKLDKPVSIYVFSWGDNEFPDDFAEIKDAKVKTIPAPILEIYKQIYNLNTK